MLLGKGIMLNMSLLCIPADGLARMAVTLGYNVKVGRGRSDRFHLTFCWPRPAPPHHTLTHRAQRK